MTACHCPSCERLAVALDRDIQVRHELAKVQRTVEEAAAEVDRRHALLRPAFSLPGDGRPRSSTRPPSGPRAGGSTLLREPAGHGSDGPGTTTMQEE